ncbi:Protein of unknown function DUF775 [Macleaya cordata]|uniref:Hikeshi-like C-terminal domain-containing protein n=1 Tax=Macleaya cordata TaxID=56857 RepID=A0A200PMW4_MACCD|nr:Protein of unknown function DUF775 [Macleaya cordata]
MCIFLLNGLSLPPDKALAIYIQSPGSPFVFCGAITIFRPFTLSDSAPLSAKICVSVEDLSSLSSLDFTSKKMIEHLAHKVGENHFNFMQSFCGVDGSRLVVPMNILDRWFKKFQEKAKKDPSYLKGFVL